MAIDSYFDNFQNMTFWQTMKIFTISGDSSQVKGLMGFSGKTARDIRVRTGTLEVLRLFLVMPSRFWVVGVSLLGRCILCELQSFP